MKITIYSDLHIGTPLEINCLPTSRRQVLIENAYSIGDIYDRKGAKKSDAERIDAALAEHQQMFNGRYVSGNHEVLGGKCENSILPIHTDRNFLLLHGDYFWGLERANSFRADTPWQGYGCIKSCIELARKIFGNRLSVLTETSAAALAAINNCDIIIFGHTHVAELQYRKINGVQIYNVPRGRTELQI